MRRTVARGTNIDTLRKDAKRWLKAIRGGDAAALARLRDAWPKAPAAPALRDIQHAIALEFGLTGWMSLKQAIADRDDAARSPDDLAGVLLRAAWDGGDPSAAARIALRHPELARHSLHNAVVYGDLAEARRRLAADPGAATAKRGSLDWEPLQYLAYSRLPLPAVADTARDLAGLLLDHGADPNAAFDDGWGNMFSVLTGVIGLGEGIRPPHPRAPDLAALLVDRGADPFDPQALYNDSIVGDDTRWLDFLWRRSVERGAEGRWTSLEEKSLGGGRMSAVDYLLGNAVSHDHLARAEWLLRHGGNPGGRNSYSKQPHHVIAQLHGFTEMASLLERHGADPARLTGQPAFLAACMQRDEAGARRLAAANPGCLDDPAPLLLGAARDRPDIIHLALDLGMPVDLEGPNGQRALHSAAHAGALAAAAALIAAGADIDRRGGNYNATPLGHGVFWKNQAMIDLIAPLSRDVHGLTASARLDRLGAVLAVEPALANALDPAGRTPLLMLPDDEDAAADAVAILLEQGADPLIAAPDGETPEQAASRRGLDEAAELIKEAVASQLQRERGLS
ncbi:ankyrin repeat domain-containing protein [Sphingomonas oligophenolica]|uniref:Ankyrin repeat domain-containing protein n=1 Tax=Sphingomonas oligophenolica TaxID=301154 RepID=A0ABU9Y4G2_9SPHN